VKQEKLRPILDARMFFVTASVSKPFKQALQSFQTEVLKNNGRSNAL
jgi:hypothetical protein